MTEKKSTYVKNYGIWVKYNSRSGTHNMYREYRDTHLNSAIDNLYNDMAGSHRSRFRSIQIIGTASVKAGDCKRVTTTQFHKGDIKFPLPSRVLRAPTKQLRPLYLAKRPHTYFG
ncbi:hypothetical protein EON64_18795 [archaeon]|nr:MAG: hypothetical protein EON64_18795 [archaeon]